MAQDSPPPAANPEAARAAVRARATQFVEAVKARDLEAAAALMPAGRRRTFSSRDGRAWLDALTLERYEIADVKLADDGQSARVRVAWRTAFDVQKFAGENIANLVENLRAGGASDEDLDRLKEDAKAAVAAMAFDVQREMEMPGALLMLGRENDEWVILDLRGTAALPGAESAAGAVVNFLRAVQSRDEMALADAIAGELADTAAHGPAIAAALHVREFELTGIEIGESTATIAVDWAASFDAAAFVGDVRQSLVAGGMSVEDADRAMSENGTLDRARTLQSQFAAGRAAFVVGKFAGRWYVRQIGPKDSE